VRNSKLLGRRNAVWESSDVTDPDMPTLDHLDRALKKMDVSRLVRASYSWKTIMLEIGKCRVLCANPHQKHTIQEFGYKAWRN
jgi:hypothetical protein